VLGLVAGPVGKREAVVHGDMVDARARLSAIVLKLRGRSGHAVSKIADQVTVTAPIAPHGVAVEVVPFRPAGREGADLIPAGANVPGLGDQLDLAQHRILPDGSEKGRVGVESRPASQRGGEVKT